MTLCAFVWIAAMACSTDAIPTAPSGPEQNQLVSTISIDPSDAVIQPDDREILKAQIRGARGQVVNGRDITWTTSDDEIIDIDASGNILAVNEGTATITARHKTVAGSATVDVRGDVVEILFNDVPDLTEGQALAVNATYHYSNGATRVAQRVKWWSEDREIARIDGDGELLGIGEGTVNIYAAGRGRSASRRIRVGKEDVSEVVVHGHDRDIVVGERRELWAEVLSTSGDRLYRKLGWSSSNTSVATVDKNGGVTGITPGSATITATVGGVTGSVDVTIVAAASSGGSSGGSEGGSGGSGSGGSSGQSVPTEVTDLAVTDTRLAAAVLSFTRVDDGTGADAKYEVRFDVAEGFDWSRAHVAQKGNCDSISSGSPGQTVTCVVEGLLAATDYSFQLVSYRVSGSEEIFGELSNLANGRTDDPAVVVDVVPSGFSIDVGETKQMTSTVTDEFGNPLSGNVTWTSTSSGVASVSSGGMVTGNAAGSATIRATALSTSGSSTATIVQPVSDGGEEGGSGGGSGSGGGGGSIPPSSGWSPRGQQICDEDFTRFADWNAFMSGATCGWNLGRLDGWGRNNVDVSTADGLMYRFRADPARCGDQMVGEATLHLPAGTREVWVEFVARWSTNYTNVNPNCSSPAPDYKQVLIWFPVGVEACGHKRLDALKTGQGSSGDVIHSSTAGFPQCDDVAVNHNGTTQSVRAPGMRALYDGNWHTFRIYAGLLGGDRCQVLTEIDGVATHDYVIDCPNTGDNGVALTLDRAQFGSNRNLGATQDMFLWWRNIKTWAQ